MIRRDLLPRGYSRVCRDSGSECISCDSAQPCGIPGDPTPVLAIPRGIFLILVHMLGYGAARSARPAQWQAALPRSTSDEPRAGTKRQSNDPSWRVSINSPYESLARSSVRGAGSRASS